MPLVSPAAHDKGVVTAAAPCLAWDAQAIIWHLLRPTDPRKPENRMKPILSSAVALVLAFACMPAAAQGDPARGQTLFYTCTGCHGIADYKNVYPLYRVPKVGGQNEQYLITALKSYRSGERTHSTMQAQGEALTDQEIADIAAYLSSHKPAK